jgi:hypothetical protein
MKRTLLSIAFTAAASSMIAQDCSELFISEYVEGNFNNKALEIFNPTLSAIDLSTYRVVRWSNGSTTSDLDTRYTQPLSGTIQPSSTFVLALDKRDANGTGNDTILFAELLNITNAAVSAGSGGFYSPDYESGDVGSRAIYHNGDDAISIQKDNGAGYVNVDIFGVIGEQPLPSSGTSTAAWTDVFPFSDGQGPYWTKEKTLIRKSSVTQGVAANPGTPYTGAFNPTVEYDSLPQNTFSNLGTHSCVCTVGVNEYENMATVRVFPNPSNTGSLEVSASDRIQRIRLFNLIGSEVLVTRATNSLSTRIDISELTSGLYLMQLEIDNSAIVTRRVEVL